MFNPFNWYLVANFLYKKKIPGLPKLITLIIRLIFSCYAPHSADIGRRCVLGYGGLGVVLHARVVIGNDCHIDQGVTIGGTSKKIGVPALGNRVYVGAGAKILGPIRIGDDVVIGANCVVVEDIPSNSLVVGVPGRVLKKGIYKSEYI